MQKGKSGKGGQRRSRHDRTNHPEKGKGTGTGEGGERAHTGRGHPSMFALSVRFLDGTCQAVDLRPDSTIAELRGVVEQERSIPRLHQIKFLQGPQLLKDDDKIKVETVEVQAVVMFSTSKAVKAIERAVWWMSEMGFRIFSGEVRQDADTALDLLDLEQDLPTNLCKRFLTAFERGNWVPSKFAVKAGHTFGRVCGDPEQYLKRLRAFEVTRNYADNGERFALAALLQITSRCNSSMQHHARHIADFVRTSMQHQWDFRSQGIDLCCRLLGQVGDPTDVPAIQRLKRTINTSTLSYNHHAAVDIIYEAEAVTGACLLEALNTSSTLSYNRVDGIIKEAEAAIQLIQAREQPSATMDNEKVEFHGHGGQVEDSTDQAGTSQESMHETENAASLMQALMNSKQDLPKTGLPLNSDGVVVLRLTRMAGSERLREHLRATPTLAPCRQRVEDAGCSLENQEWGHGAQFWVPLTHEQVAEAELELSFDNVVILSSDVEQFKLALHEFNRRGKKRRTDEGAVEVELVGFLDIHTDSSLGFTFPPAFRRRISWPRTFPALRRRERAAVIP